VATPATPDFYMLPPIEAPWVTIYVGGVVTKPPTQESSHGRADRHDLCLCDDLVQERRHRDDPQSRLTGAEVMTTIWLPRATSEGMSNTHEACSIRRRIYQAC
jgi:hypothetical protein